MAYRQALDAYMRERLPLDGGYDAEQPGDCTAGPGHQHRRRGSEGAIALAWAEAVHGLKNTAQALRVHARDMLPSEWAQTYTNLARVYVYLGNLANGGGELCQRASSEHPDDKEAYDTASHLSHESGFLVFRRPFALTEQWLERHPEERLTEMIDFAKSHFTTGRFAGCEECTAVFIDSSRLLEADIQSRRAPSRSPTHWPSAKPT